MKDINELKKELFEAIDTICKDYEKEPEFKIPGWYVEDIIFYAKRADRWCLFNDCGHPFDKCSCRPATPAEIEAHLKKICDEKGLMKHGRKYRSALGGGYEYRDDSQTEYIIGHDSLYNRGMALYSKGKFAEILPSLKKLPKTKEEFREFLLSYDNDAVDEFLQNYED